MQLKSFVLAVIVALVLVLPARAHHSHNNYDTTKWTPFEGTVKEVHWLFPHSWIYIEVKNEKGEAAIWALEAANPNSIMENGVTKAHVSGWRPHQSAVPPASRRRQRLSARLRHAAARRRGAGARGGEGVGLGECWCGC